MINTSGRILGVLLCTVLLPACSTHIYRQESATLAQKAKTTYTDKVDLLSLAATARANLTKQREADIAAVKQSQLLERDSVFFNAARLTPAERLNLLRLPADVESRTCDQSTSLPYLSRRACALGAPSMTFLRQLAAAVPKADRVEESLELVENQRADLMKLGWAKVPECSNLAPLKSIPEAVKATIAANDLALAEGNFLELRKNCERAYGNATLGQPALARDLATLERHDLQKRDLKAAAAVVEKDLTAYATRLKAIAEKTPQPGDTLKKIQDEIGNWRKTISEFENLAKSVGAEEKLADEKISALSTLLAAAEGTTITDEMVKGKNADLRRAVVVAHAFPQLAGDFADAYALYRMPPKSSLLLAQRQAMIDKERLAASREVLERRRLLVLQRIEQTVTEAKLLQQAALQADCKPEECASQLNERILLGYNYLSRSLLGARADGEATQWEESYLDLEQNVLNDEYALKSWNNLISTPIALIDGYHAGGIKPEALGDLLAKFAGLGLLGIAVDKTK